MNIYEEWIEAKKNLKKAKDKEFELRLKIIEKDYPKNQSSGSKTFIKNNFKIKASKSFNFKVEDSFNSIKNKLNKAELDCIKTSYKLDLKKYKKLPENSLLHKVITSKESTPTLDVKIIEENNGPNNP